VFGREVAVLQDQRTVELSQSQFMSATRQTEVMCRGCSLVDAGVSWSSQVTVGHCYSVTNKCACLDICLLAYGWSKVIGLGLGSLGRIACRRCIHAVYCHRFRAVCVPLS